MQWKPHSFILNVLEYKFKSMKKLMKFNIMYRVSAQRSSLFTITLPIAGWALRKSRGGIGNQQSVETLEIRNYRNLYFDQKAKENAQSPLWGNSIEKDQVKRN